MARTLPRLPCYIEGLGLYDRFMRMPDYYLAFCEGAFLDGHISDFQLLPTRNCSKWPLFQESGDLSENRQACASFP
jgi:hypothetical protein